jgi:mono/diheme cytochrome c family protein
VSDGAKLVVWPLALGAYVVAMVVVLAVVTPFEPQAPAAASDGVATADVYRGETVYQRSCASCHGDSGRGGIGPGLAGSGLTASQIAAQIRSGGGAMPPALVTGQEEADVAAFVAQLAAG